MCRIDRSLGRVNGKRGEGDGGWRRGEGEGVDDGRMGEGEVVVMVE